MTLVSRVCFFSVLLLAWFTPSVSASGFPIQVDVYRFSDGVPVRDSTLPLCASFQVEMIDFDWGGDLVADCDYDQVVVRFSGYLTVVERSLLVVQHDDGASLSLDGSLVVDSWWDTGCAWDFVWVDPGVYEFEYWFYENGGAACARLWYSDENQFGYEPVPSGWFTTSTTSTSTTTTTTTTTSTTTTSTTTTSTTTTTAPPPTTIALTTIPETTSTSEVPISLQPEVPTTTIPTPPPTVAPSTTVPIEVTSTSSAPSTSFIIPTTTTTTTVVTPTAPAVTTTTLEPLNSILDTIENLDTISAEEAATLIEEIADLDLTDEQAAELADALSDAPDEIKTRFQETINVFGGQFDNYVPTGSTVTVGQRRTIVAASGTMTIAAVPARRRR